jgi:CHAT domain-containing protein
MAAMITAGASSLVTSLWKTHDTASTALMNALYDALEAGDDLATALRRSQQSVRRQFDHPAMWAPFTGMHARIRR